MYQVYWSPDAKDSYADILRSVMDNFPLDTALKMDEKVERLISLLENNQQLCPPAKNFPEVRKCVVTKQLSLVYRIVGNDIELVVFLDNRMKHPF